ncbi:MAG: DUF4013 domain-containing protein [Nitrososphaerales archaeon]
MDLVDNLNDSLNFAKKMFDNLGKLLILIILNIIPIVNFIIIGYAARIIKDSPSIKEAPKLENYRSLWIQGLKILIVILIYSIIPIIIMSVSIIPLLIIPWAVGRTFEMFTIMPFISKGFVTPIFILGLILTILSLIFSIIGAINMIKYDQFKKAFDLKEILTIIKGIGWGKYIMWLIIMFIIALFIGGLSNIPYIGWLISLVISPIYLIFLSRSAALIYMEGITRKNE